MKALLLLALLGARVVGPLPCQAVDFLGGINQALQGVKDIFGGGGNQGQSASNAANTAQQWGPIVAKSTHAILFTMLPDQGNSSSTLTLPCGYSSDCNVTIFHPSPNQVVFVFQGLDQVDLGSEPLELVPYLEQWVATAEAPLALVEAFMPLAEGPGPEGSLADAVAELVGGYPVLHVICTGEGAGGAGLAAMCGPWAGLAFPQANVDVFGFGEPPSAVFRNTQFSWSFARLVTLLYFWNFTSSDLGVSPGGGDASALAQDLGRAMSALVTESSLQAAVTLPNLPPSVPPGLPQGQGSGLGSLGPLAPAVEEPRPEECRAILCKTRDPITFACLVFSSRGLPPELQGLPTTRMHASSGADAVVAWNESVSTAVIAWQGTETRLDWAQDLLLFQSDDFRPGNLSAVVPQVQVHRGFLNQFSSFTTSPSSDADNMTSVLLSLSGGKAPQRIIVTGHSLGAALSELTAVWVSTVWPNATVLNANTGAPRVGNAAWERMYRSVVGQGYRYVNGLDQVPALPPLDSYVQVPEGIWLRDGLVLLQDRPQMNVNDLTWDDHDCADLYVPAVDNATAVTVPAFVYVYNATSA